MSLFDNNKGLLNELKNDIIQKRIPLNANLYLTNKCNFKCLHCYVQSIKNKDKGAINVSQWKKIIDELRKKGCISITLSGGEVLASEKFVEIYEYLYECNFSITIISNLSLLNKAQLECLTNKKPNKIITTLYGITEETYFNFCGVKNFCNIVKNNILEVHRRGINIQLQTVLNTINCSELSDMKLFAASNGIEFLVFRNIFCEINGDSKPLQYQITLEQELASYDILKDGTTFLQNAENNKSIIWKNGYKFCYAGIANCYIDCCGNMYLCNHSCNEKFNILEMGFDNAWNKIYLIRKKEIEKWNPCFDCNNKYLCGKCTPTFNVLKNSIGFPFEDCQKIEKIKEKLMEEI